MNLIDSSYKLAKLHIEAFRERNRRDSSKVGETLSVLYNPESFAMHYESELQSLSGLGASATPACWVRSKPKELSVKLILDDVRVSHAHNGAPESVARRVEAFLAACHDPNSESHEPLYLKVRWGDGPLLPGFDCRLQSVDVAYTSFKRDGSPLRAELSASFVEDVDQTKAAAKARKSSPDLTHARVVEAGDTLPQLCLEIYGSARHYLRVAEANELDDFRELVPGTQLHFPPFDRGER